MRIQPLHSQLVIAPILAGDTTKGGLLVPHVARNNAPYRYGDVIEVGLGRTNAEGKTVGLQVKIGDTVAYAKGAGLEFPLEDDAGERIVLLLDEKYVLGIVHDLKRPSSIIGVDGALLSIEPKSRTQTGHAQGALHDSSYKNQEELDRAQRDWNIDTTDHVDEPS